MARGRRAEGILWLRPLLGVRRAALRDWLAARGRGLGRGPEQRRPALRPGAGAGGAAAARGARARAGAAGGDGARRWRGRGRRWSGRRPSSRGACLDDGRGGGSRCSTRRRSPAAPEELRLRLLAGALCWVVGRASTGRGWCGSRRRWRRSRAARVGHGLTLHGCVLRPRGGRVAIRREPARVAPPVPLARRALGRALAARGRRRRPATGLTIGALGAGRAGAARRTGAPPGWRARRW